MKKAVLFDCDGVLINSERYYLQGTADWLRQYGYNYDIKDLVKIVGTTYDVTCQMLSDMCDFDKDKVREINDNYFATHPLDFANLVKPHALELMQYCQQNNIKMAICTSSSPELINHIVKVCHFDQYVHYYISGDLLSASKPDPQIYNLATKKLEVEKNECIIVEDSASGIQAGYNAGIFTIALLDDLIVQDTHLANAKIKDLKQVIDYLY